MQFIEYPRCSTCKKAKKFLVDNKINFVDRNILEDTPTKDELYEWLDKYEVSLPQLFNTSGIKYRELNLKEKKLQMSVDEMILLLASDGMLIKRPLLVTDDKILIGFKEKEWKLYFKEEK
ncbi:MAG: Spx/MgsR family RNA polymerase-binding regulatory protein [Bacilli bacterium]|nr:Spx/MgsR family RNA polymerase-binding regulatory protein [Bacilli bacterium]